MLYPPLKVVVLYGWPLGNLIIIHVIVSVNCCKPFLFQLQMINLKEWNPSEFRIELFRFSQLKSFNETFFSFQSTERKEPSAITISIFLFIYFFLLSLHSFQFDTSWHKTITIDSLSYVARQCCHWIVWSTRSSVRSTSSNRSESFGICWNDIFEVGTWHRRIVGIQSNQVSVNAFKNFIFF